MENSYPFGSEELEIRLPTPLEIKEIKQMLLTGDRDQILLSVEKIKKFLTCEESVCEILRSDILEFLCDVLLPFDSVVACTLYECLEIMVTHYEFFAHNHSCFMIESLRRTLHFLMKDCDNCRGLNECLNLLILTLQGYNSHSVTPENKTIENLLQVLPAVKNLPPTVNNKYQAGAFIYNLIELNLLNWSPEACDIILTSLSSWFNLMNEILESEHSVRERLILLSCKLCHSTLRYLFSNESSVEKLNFEVNQNSKREILKKINNFLITVGAPYFASAPLSKIENNITHLESFYQAILLFYTDETTPEKTCLIHGLSETGFLQFTTKVINFAEFSQGQKLRRLCILVLFYMILCLAEDVFHFPEVWPKGRDDFRCEVQRGIAQLPSNATQWLDVLVNPQTSFSSKLVLLLYLYFYSMTAKSQDKLQVLYPAIVSFIRFNSEIQSSVLLLKVVWFVFVQLIVMSMIIKKQLPLVLEEKLKKSMFNHHLAFALVKSPKVTIILPVFQMSQLSITQSSSLEIKIGGTNEMVALLEAQQDLSLVYTHHPALLYWVFSSKVSRNIQTQTVHLWLRKKTPDCKELDELLKNSSDVRFAILDILQNGWGQELDSAFSSVKSLLLNPNTDDDLAVNIWYLLPQVLSQFTVDFTSVNNVDYIIELSSLRTPKSLDITKIIRVAYLLTEVLSKSDLISVIPTLSLVFQLLRLGYQMEGNRVLWVFLRHDEFIKKIIEGLNTNVSEIFSLSIKIMIVLWKECQDVINTEGRKVEIKSEVILKMVNTNCDQTLHQGLKFLQEILLSSFRSPIFEIEEIDGGFLEILFLEILNACIKTTVENSKCCWRCLKLFLLKESLGGELVTNPLLHELIILSLPQLKESEELKDFLAVWMEFYNKKVKDPCFERKIFGGFYSETVMTIGRELMGEDNQEDEMLFEKVLESGFFGLNPVRKENSMM